MSSGIRAKDQVMSVCKLALATLGMWVREEVCIISIKRGKQMPRGIVAINLHSVGVSFVCRTSLNYTK